MTIQISKDIGVGYCLNCTKTDCDGTVDSLCPIFLNRTEIKKEILRHKIELYIELSEYLEINGPMTTREIMDVFEIRRSGITRSIREGLLLARWLSKEEKKKIRGGARGRFAYLVLAVDLDKIVARKMNQKETTNYR